MTAEHLRHKLMTYGLNAVHAHNLATRLASFWHCPDEPGMLDWIKMAVAFMPRDYETIKYALYGRSR